MLRIYDLVRRPFANEAVNRSYSLGRLAEFLGLPEHIDESRLRMGWKEELEELGREIEKMWNIHFMSLLDDDWKEAERMLRELTGQSNSTKL